MFFFTVMMFFGCNLLSVNPFKGISMKNKNLKQDQKLLMFIVINLYFFRLVLKQVNAVVAVIISMTHMQNCVLVMLLKTLISKFLI